MPENFNNQKILRRGRIHPCFKSHLTNSEADRKPTTVRTKHHIKIKKNKKKTIQFIPLVCSVRRSQQTAAGSAGSLWPAARSPAAAPSPPPEGLEMFSQQTAKANKRKRSAEDETLTHARPRCRRSTGRAAQAFCSQDTGNHLRDGTVQTSSSSSFRGRFIENASKDIKHCVHHKDMFVMEIQFSRPGYGCKPI